MSFLQRFQTSLESLYVLPEGSNYVVAYSGGIDSHVLLHCCYKLNVPVRAVHIHHGLQSIADDWVKHCQQVCDDLNISLEIIYVDGEKKNRQSPEESARIARYLALQNNLLQGDCLLTAQHLDDQAETFLLQLFRSASSAGLAAMPVSKTIGRNLHLRPLLFFSRSEIETYANENKLVWVEDPSNQDENLDRNFVRKSVLPLLQSRWPETVKQLVKASDIQFDNLQVLEDMASVDLAHAKVMLDQVIVSENNKQYYNRIYAYDLISVLSISILKKLSIPRLHNVLRLWVKELSENLNNNDCSSFKGMLPTRNLLLEIEKTIIHSQHDASPVIVFSDFEFRKYNDNLYLLKPKSFSNSLKRDVMNHCFDLNWTPSQEEIEIDAIDCTLRAVNYMSGGLNKKLLNEDLKLTLRRGGEVFQPNERDHSQRLKKLFQEANIPPWERDWIPLLYWKEEVIAVVGYWVCKKYAVSEGEEGWFVSIKHLDA